jgi:hypothetical protein
MVRKIHTSTDMKKWVVSIYASYRKVPGSDFDNETAYVNWCLRCLSHFFQENADWARRPLLPSTSFPIHHEQIILPFHAT